MNWPEISGRNYSKMISDLVREIEIEKELFRREAREDFRSFIAYTMPDYQFNWHHIHLIRKLEAFQRGEIRRLMVFMPPRHGKSQLVSRHLPAWIFGQNPEAKIIACSYSSGLATEMSLSVQRIMVSDEYKDLFSGTRIRETRSATQDQSRRTSDLFDIVGQKGHYLSSGVGGPITGKGAEFAIIDDPIKNQQEAESPTYRENVWNWYTSTLYTRLEKDAGLLLTQTRWHEDDLAGRLLKQMEDKDNEFAEQWEVVDFPAIKITDENPDDPREIGEALWPGKYDEKRLGVMKSTLGTRYWNALYDQKPVVEGGNIIKEEWFRTYQKGHIDPPTINFYLDSAFTNKTQNDPSAIMAYFELNNNLYIWHSKTIRMGFVELVAFLQEYIKSYGSRAGYLKVEPKASGLDIIDYLRRETDLTVIEDDPPKDNKVTRVYAATPYMEGGRVLVPEGEAWVSDFMAEMKAFPAGKHDDQVDCLTGAIKDTIRDEGIFMVGWSR